MSATIASRKSFLQKLLDGVEIVGNKVPHPAIIFLIMSAIVIVLSQLFHMLGTSVTYQVIDPVTHQVQETTATVNSLMTPEGIRFIITSVVRNFLGFGPVGVILVAMVGVELAEEAGLIGAIIRKIVLVAPRRLITFIIVAMGVLSSVASDAGYLVLIPLGAAAFLSLGRHPIAGLAAAFSGVAAVFNVNLIITPIDGVLTEITNDAIHLLNPNYSLYLTANIYFSIVSSILLCIVCTIITERVIEPRLGPYTGDAKAESADADIGQRGEPDCAMRSLALIGSLVVIGLLALPPGAPLRNPVTGALIGDSPLMNSLIVLIAGVFFATGFAYGRGAGTITNADAGHCVDHQDLLRPWRPAVPVPGDQPVPGALQLQQPGDDRGGEPVRRHRTPQHARLAAADRIRGGDCAGEPDHSGGHREMGDPGADFRAAVHEAECRPGHRAGGLPCRRFAGQRDHAFDGLFRHDRYLRSEISRKTPGVGTVVAMMLPYTVVLYVVWTVLLIVWYLFGIPLGI